MFSLISLSVVGLADDSARRLFGSDPITRRLDADDFGLHDHTCVPVSHTWSAGWTSRAGSLIFDAPSAEKNLRYVLRLNDDTTAAWADVGDSSLSFCGSCTMAVSTEDDLALVIDPADWTDEHTTFSHYLNFGAAAVDVDFVNVDLYFCYETPVFELYFEPSTDLKGTISGIMGFLAQGSWETGTWTACDEENHTNSPTAACTQRPDGALYQDLTDSVNSCALDATMEITGKKAKVQKYAWDSTLSCGPEGTDLENCCWWGRGSIQTTGPSNYGELQNDILDKSSTLSHIDLCANPGAICEEAELKFVAGIYFWVTQVETDECFANSLSAYTSAYDTEATANDESGNSCRSFARGIGGKVNMGNWAETSHGEDCAHRHEEDSSIDCSTSPDGRVERFEALMTKAKTAIATYESGGVEATATDCTGYSAVDTVFHNMKLESTTGFDGTNSVYTFTGFCDALKEFIKDD